MLCKNNLCAILYGAEDIRLEKRPVPQPRANQVVIKMEYIGICGSDLHLFLRGDNGRGGCSVSKHPTVIGHEGSGTVTAIGKGVTDLQIGDRVAVEPGVGCRICPLCKKGTYHLCPEMNFSGSPPIDGLLSRYCVKDSDFCHKLPKNVGLEEGALMEPLAVGVHACKRAGLRFGDFVLIFGAGPIGLVTLLTAKAMGASKVVMIDVVVYRLEKAKELGADFIFKTEENMSVDFICSKIEHILGKAPNVSFDCTGAEQCVKVALMVTKTGGVVTLVGLGKYEMNLPLANVLTRELDIRGVFRYNNDFPMALKLVQSRKVNLKALISHYFHIENTLKAFHLAKSRDNNPIKILIHA